MAKKFLLIVLIILMVGVLSSCQKASSNSSLTNNMERDKVQHNTDYEIRKVIYSNQNDAEQINIEYPEITGMKDIAKQEILNSILKKEAFKDFEHNSDAENFLTYEGKYKLSLKRYNLLSVQYTGYMNYKGAAHPNNMYNSCNIDLDKGEYLKLEDLIDIDKEFVEAFKSKSRFIYMAGTKLNLDEKSSDFANEYINNLPYDELIKDFQRDDYPFYLTDDSLGIVIFLSHSGGDNWEFEIKYNEIKDCIYSDRIIWRELLGN